MDVEWARFTTCFFFCLQLAESTSARLVEILIAPYVEKKRNAQFYVVLLYAVIFRNVTSSLKENLLYICDTYEYWYLLRLVYFVLYSCGGIRHRNL
jgi:hypothetical protein